jgi:hypothetical protein
MPRRLGAVALAGVIAVLVLWLARRRWPPRSTEKFLGRFRYFSACTPSDPDSPEPPAWCPGRTTGMMPEIEGGTFVEGGLLGCGSACAACPDVPPTIPT